MLGVLLYCVHVMDQCGPYLTESLRHALPCAGVIVSGIALVLSCCLREAVQLTDSLKNPGKAALAGEQEPLMQVRSPDPCQLVCD